MLEEESLYEKLNSFYIKQLQKIIFYNEPKAKEVKPLNSYQRSFFELVQRADITELKLIYKACGLVNKFEKNLKKFFKCNADDLYAELYQKLCG